MKLADIYRQVPTSQCPPHCGKCCGILYPGLAELRNIKQWCQQHRVEFHDFTMDIGADCPYLMADKCCRIYPVRPLLCRIHGVSEEKRLRCPDCKTGKLLNVTITRYLFKKVYGERKERGRKAKHQRDLDAIFGRHSS